MQVAMVGVIRERRSRAVERRRCELPGNHTTTVVPRVSLCLLPWYSSTRLFLRLVRTPPAPVP
eukprot:3646389-Prymnesium_polylepis.1